MSSAATVFSLKLLGGCSLESATGMVAGRVAQRRRLACVALLAVAGRHGLGRDKLLVYLWPERDTDAARHFLSDTLYVLRAGLGDEVLITPGDSVVLNSSLVTCDVATFEDALARGDMARAAALYAGPFLDGFHISDAPEFERWVDAERNRIESGFAGAVEALALKPSSVPNRQAQ
jgi:serine/threonine-protein kinase